MLRKQKFNLHRRYSSSMIMIDLAALFIFIVNVEESKLLLALFTVHYEKLLLPLKVIGMLLFRKYYALLKCSHSGLTPNDLVILRDFGSTRNSHLLYYVFLAH